MQEAQAVKVRHATRVLQLLQGKWTLQILLSMRHRPVRLSELKRAIPSASKKALTSSLRSLVAGGIVVRTDLSGMLLHVEYSLSQEMESSIVALLDQMIMWGEAYEENIGASSLKPQL